MASTPSYYASGDTFGATGSSSLTTLGTLSSDGFITGFNVVLEDTSGNQNLDEDLVINFFLDIGGGGTLAGIGSIQMRPSDVTNQYVLNFDSIPKDRNGQIAIPASNTDIIKCQSFLRDSSGSTTTTGLEDHRVSVSVMYY